ncbi:MAG: NAD(P)-binding domain-containing protein, partial [Flavobacteriaceae bacterium]
MKIAILGAGNLGLSIARGLITNNSITKLYLTRRSVDSIATWSEYANTHITADNKKAVQESDIIILAVQPRQLGKLLAEINDLLHENHVLISTVTGFSIAKMEETVGKDVHIIRSMPNTAISVGKSMTCLCANEKGKERLAIAEAIFNGLGTSIIIEEQHMRAATVICASGIAFWMRLIRATTQGGVQLGFDAEEAMKMSMYTAMGAASLLIETASTPATKEEIKVGINQVYETFLTRVADGRSMTKEQVHKIAQGRVWSGV